MVAALNDAGATLTLVIPLASLLVVLLWWGFVVRRRQRP
jgi:hypothetical protein